MDSETFGVESGYGQEVIQWLNDEAKKDKLKFEARLYGQQVETQNFGSFELFSWMGDVQVARKLTVKASKRFKVKVIEGGYKTKEKILKMSRQDYAMVKKGDRVIGHLEFSAPRFGGKWQIIQEELR
ncbi:MAG: hypothetical protein EB150_02200 [Nitrososphaeria archaeon]|nr:hypothetical protein [Nitrososphaeria archaeon]NDB50771.1 hypothetical protein [Nitrosopumilaceae archaeon]NDB87486.1 hypothetical protein [Nitrososphaerota archaeon]NDB45936.1 hypothetical protein [Nitrososphaeria archaeon]NDB62927.1 hypothetical protein [Nitrosopumilaceae archaeon]